MKSTPGWYQLVEGTEVIYFTPNRPLYAKKWKETVAAQKWKILALGQFNLGKIIAGQFNPGLFIAVPCSSLNTLPFHGNDEGNFFCYEQGIDMNCPGMNRLSVDPFNSSILVMT